VNDEDNEITLTPEQSKYAAEVGLFMRAEVHRMGGTEAYGLAPEDGEEKSIQGAQAEYACHLWFGVPWDGRPNTFGRIADMGEDIEIRNSSLHHWGMNMRPEDKPDRVYILVTGQDPTFRIQGWIRGHEGRRDEWWTNYGLRHRPYLWSVPQSALHREWKLPE
jgi:hypothetical protein